jgi:hypothetical protein
MPKTIPSDVTVISFPDGSTVVQVTDAEYQKSVFFRFAIPPAPYEIDEAAKMGRDRLRFLLTDLRAITKRLTR